MFRADSRQRSLAIAAIALTTLAFAAGSSRTSSLASQQLPDDSVAEPATPPAEVFSESVAVRVVNVEVFVTDKKGNPIEGMTVDDFELYEDGRRVEITNFFSARDEIAGERATGEATAADPTLPAASQGGNDTARPPMLVVYVDNMNLRPGGRQRLLDDLVPFLDRNMAEGAKVMVAVHGLEGLRPLLEPTSDRSRVASALAEVTATTPMGFRLDLERRSILQLIRDIYRNNEALPGGPCDQGANDFNRAVEDHATLLLAHNESTANGLSIMVGALVGWPGVKTLLYVSDGMPEFAGSELFAYLADLCPESAPLFMRNFSRFSSTNIFERVTQRANSNRVTIYALETSGLNALSMNSVESEGRYAERSFTPSPGNDRIRTANLQSTLFQIANETGGRAILNANEFERDLRRIGSDTRSYYSLGFKARQRGDGDIHRLRVEVRNSKHRVRHRTAYRDKPVEEVLAERALGALIFDLEDNELEAVVETRQQTTADGKQEIVVGVRIPYSALALLPTGEHWQGRLRVLLTARDENNTLLPIKEKIVPVIAESDPAAAEGSASQPGAGQAWLEIGIALPPGDHELALALHDEISGTSSFLRRAVRVEALAAGREGPAVEPAPTGSSDSQ